VRLSAQSGYDRFVLEFTGPVPGYAVRYVKAPIREDPSNKVVIVAGNAFLQIRLEPASGTDLASNNAKQTYTGPDRIRSDSAVVTEAVLTGDFEAVMSWVLGVDGRHPFRVSTLQSPSRLVVDIAVTP